MVNMSEIFIIQHSTLHTFSTDPGHLLHEAHRPVLGSTQSVDLLTIGWL